MTAQETAEAIAEITAEAERVAKPLIRLARNNDIDGLADRIETLSRDDLQIALFLLAVAASDAKPLDPTT